MRLWESNWQRAGWKPMLLTLLNASQSKFYVPSENVFDQALFALESVGGGWLASHRLFINTGLKARRPKEPLIVEPWTLVWMAPRVKLSLRRPNSVSRFSPEDLSGFRLFDSVSSVLDSGICH